MYTRYVKFFGTMYVQHDLSAEQHFNPVSTDRTFYPMLCDIKNHICKAKKALELTKLDQENLRLKMDSEDWKQSFPSSNFYFRLYVKDDKRELCAGPALQIVEP